MALSPSGKRFSLDANRKSLDDANVMGDWKWGWLEDHLDDDWEK